MNYSPEYKEAMLRRMLPPKQIKSWKDACMNANGGIAKEAARLNRELKSAIERSFDCQLPVTEVTGL